MLVYIHVPFCRSKCNYCAFHSIPLEQAGDGAIKSYIDTLLAELAFYGQLLGKRKVRSIFFGGGTPSLLPAEAVENILTQIKSNFALVPRPEITLEANPESLRQLSIIQDYRSAGVNRLSIGLQSLDDPMLKMLGRPHKARDSMAAIDLARTAGFANINVDLMWGLPGQSMRNWLETLKETINMGPDHISAYGLTLEPGTPLEEDYENGLISLPPERDQSIMFMEGSAILEKHGFLHYEISNFAKMGYQCRHNLGYWEGADYLGLGPSSTSTIGQKRWTNPASIEGWREWTSKGLLGSSPEILTPRTRLLELMMLRLRTARGLRLKAYKDFTGRDFLTDHQRLVQTMHENGLIRIRNGYLSLTRSGMLVSNTIISNLFERVDKALEEQPERISIKRSEERKQAFEE